MTDPERYAPAMAVAGTVALVAGVAVGGWLGLMLVGVSAVLFAAACRSKSDGLLLFGPFVEHDLRRATRKYRVHLWRALTLAAVGLPILLLALFAFGPVPAGSRLPTNRVTMVAETGFLAVVWHMFLILSATSAQHLAASVAEDREAKRLDFTLVTDLRSREIVVGKAVARTLSSLGYLLPAVPLLIVLPAWFGVEPALILYCFGIGAVSVFSLGCLAVYGSVVSKTKKLSGQMPGRVIGPYLILGLLLAQLSAYPIWFWPGSNVAPAAYAVGDAIDLFNVGNPLAIGRSFMWSMIGGFNLGPIAAAFPAYAAFHIGLGVVFLLLAIRRLRPVSADLAGEPPPPEEVLSSKKRPAVTDLPILWKDMYCLPSQWNTRANRIAGYVVLTAFGLVPAFAFLAAAGLGAVGMPQTQVVELSRWVAPIVAIISAATGLNFGAMAIARERERDTLPSLLTTPLPLREIVRQKLLGALGVGRAFWYWQLIVGIPAVICGGIPVWTYPVILLGQALFTVLATCCGLMASASAATVEKASRNVAFVFLAGILVVSVAAGGLLALGAVSNPGPPAKPLLAIVVGLYPPAGLVMIGHADLAPPGELPIWAFGIVSCWAGYAALGWWFWNLAVSRFVRTCEEPDGDPRPTDKVDEAPVPLP